MSACPEWARLHEGDVQFDVVCDRDADPNTLEHGGPCHDPELGDWDRVVGLHDRSKTPTEERKLF